MIWSFTIRRGTLSAQVESMPYQGGLRPDPPQVLMKSDVMARPNVVTFDKIPGQDAFVMIVNANQEQEPIAGDVVLKFDWRATWEK